MIIGVDIDGTLTDFSGFILANAVPFMEQFGMAVRNPCGYDVDEIFEMEQALLEKGCSSIEAAEQSKAILDLFWKRYYLKYCFSPLRDNAKRVMRRFKKDGHRLVIISSRKHTCEKTLLGRTVRLAALLQLLWNEIPYHEVIFYPNDAEKVTAILEKDIALLIDDKPEIMEQIGQRKRVIAMGTDYNASLPLSPRIHRANDWPAVYDLAAQDKAYAIPRMQDSVRKQSRFYKAVRILSGPLIRCVWKPIVVHAEMCRKPDGATIFAPNHRRTVDPLIISAFIDAPIHWAALKRFFDGQDSIFNNSKNKLLCSATAFFFKKLGFIPIDRTTCNLDAARKMRQLLALGRCIGIFPEGTTNKSPEEQDVLEPKLGAAFLARSTRAWIQPISITWIPDSIHTRHRVVINFRPPYKASEGRIAEQERWTTTICDGIRENKQIIERLQEPH